MSLSGGVMILAVICIRALAINRVPKTTFLVLWGLVLARLLVPFSVPSGWSIYTLLQRGTPAAAANRVWTAPTISVPQGTVEVPQAARTVPLWGILWAAGAVLCAVGFAVAYWKCYQEFQMSFPVENAFARQWLQEHPLRRTVSIRQSDRIASPLTFGILHPVILMPKKTDWTDEATLQYVLAHELVHIRRFDTATKLLLIAAVCVHWFNPLVWAMYVLANRDLELSCDEAVIRQFGRSTRAAYAMVLIRMEETKSGVAPLCNHFSKTAIEERITAIMKTRKTTLMSLLLAAVLVAGTATAFATSGQTDAAEKQNAASVDRQLGTNVATTEEDETLLSYVDTKDGKTYYSFDGGKTFTPMTDAEFEQAYPTPDIEWWTYDEYKAWFETEKKNLQEMVGERGYTNTQGWFTWTQEMVDETIAMYESILEDIKNGMMYSKSVDGDEDVLVSYNPADVALGTSDPEKSIAIKLEDGTEKVFGPYATDEELLAAVEPFCNEQVKLGSMTQAKADEILGRYKA